MPIKAYEFTKSDDIIRHKREQLNAMMSSRDPNTQKAAHSQAFVDALFGDPAIKKARETEKAIAEAMTLEKEEGEDSLDYQIRQQEAVMRNAAKHDPNVSVQASQNLIALKAEQLERSRLKQKDDAFAAKEDRLSLEFEEARTPVIYRRGLTGDLTPEFILDREASLEEIQAKMAELEGDVVLGNMTMMYEDEGDLEEKEAPPLMAGLTKSIGNKIKNGIDQTAATILDFNTLSDILKEDPNAFILKESFADADKSIGGLEKIANFLGARFGGEEREIGTALLNDSDFAEGLKEKGMVSSVATAYAFQVAYQFAKALDPNGRLSDQDVAMAKEMILGNGRPDTITRILRERVDKLWKGAERHKNSIFGVEGMEGRGSPDMKQAYRDAEATYLRVKIEMEEVAESIAAGIQQLQSGKAPADMTEAEKDADVDRFFR